MSPFGQSTFGNVSLINDDDLNRLAQGEHYESYNKLGAHPISQRNFEGTHFALWAPNAKRVSVVGNFNAWNPDVHPMRFRQEAGIWETSIADVKPGALYKYHISSQQRGPGTLKADPYATESEVRPGNASRVCSLAGYTWDDADWMATRSTHNSLDAPISIYEVHLGSWMRAPGSGAWLTYLHSANKLADYVSDMGFTHVEIMPVTEHPLDESWGYQTVGYYAPTSRFGTPHDFMEFVDTLHQRKIGVIMDWCPAHFPADDHGLAFFDGTPLYEYEDPKKNRHPHWGTLIFNYGRNEVRNFLISNALFWLDKYHIDGLRVDAVASMLYLDYGRQEGEWAPNPQGGKENFAAVELLRLLNDVVCEKHPDVMIAAEESTQWPLVTRPTTVGGLGFDYKWNMGWMNNMFEYMTKDPSDRQNHHDKLTFGLHYAYTENFILPLSHDEVVHGKHSLLRKMPGDEWQQHANLRLLYGFMFAHPGKQLLFMGGEFGQLSEWNHSACIDWQLLDLPLHRGLQCWVRDLNRVYRSEPALFELDFDPLGFQWIDGHDKEGSVVSFLRRSRRGQSVVVVCNYTPMPRYHYRIGVPHNGEWRELLNSDASCYGGSGLGNLGRSLATERPTYAQPFSLELTLPPLGVLFLKKP